MTNKLPFFAVLAAIAILTFIYLKPASTPNQITNFEECAAAGNPIMESYPERCAANGQTFTREVEEKIRVTNPNLSEPISSPLIVRGEARGTWYFEASFPIYLYDGNGDEIAVGIAQARSDWMTEDFVEFTATLEFDQPTTENGILVFKKDNPSGLPEFDDAISIPVTFTSSEQ